MTTMTTTIIIVSIIKYWMETMLHVLHVPSIKDYWVWSASFANFNQDNIFEIFK